VSGAQTVSGAKSPGRTLADLAASSPDGLALLFTPADGPDVEYSWRELDEWSTRLARLLGARGVGADSLLAIALSNCPEHVALTFAGWKLGACVLPLNHRLPPAERDRVLELAEPTVLAAEWDIPGELTRAASTEADALSAEPLPDVVPAPGKAIASGGATGKPKLIVDPRPLLRTPLTPDNPIAVLTGLRDGQTQLLAGPLYHNGPFGAGHLGLGAGHTLVLMDRFDAARVVDLIERHRVSWMYLVPTMMRRLLDVPGIRSADLSSIEAVYHTASHCPPDLKRAWIDLVGAEHVYEGFGATEEVGLCAIRGDEWLEHPGSVGRPVDSEIRIVGADGSQCPPGTVGEIFMRRISNRDTYAYRGAARARTDAEGFATVGDLGWVDDEGYVYLADRRVDLIITGGANVYPAEVEAAVLEHPAVHDAAVVGLPDEDWGSRVHAIVEPRAGAEVTATELTDHCRSRLQPYKIPKTFEFLPRLPRDEAGKVRRSQLRAERTADG
jgi:bile acid-coenzyme A ligase